MWWLLTVWIVGSLPLGLLTARFIAIGNGQMGLVNVPGFFGQLPMPPGEGWTYWAIEPPPYSRGGAVEVWHVEMGNETDHWRLEDISTDFDPSGVWWRPA